MFMQYIKGFDVTGIEDGALSLVLYFKQMKEWIWYGTLSLSESLQWDNFLVYFEWLYCLSSLPSSINICKLKYQSINMKSNAFDT